MMLSLSAKTTETAIDLHMVNGAPASESQGIPYASELANFAEAIAKREASTIDQSRAALLEIAGEEVMVDAAAVAANFQRMVRIADSMGIPIDEKNIEVGAEVRQELELTRFASAQNTPSANR